MKYFLLLLIILQSCNSSKKPDLRNDFELMPLSPFYYEFFGQNGEFNRIDYYFLEGDFNLNSDFYKKLNDKVRVLDLHANEFHYYSIYMYEKTSRLNSKSNLTREDLSIENPNLVVYMRYTKGKQDIFYIIKNRYVIFDVRRNEKVSFDFFD